MHQIVAHVVANERKHRHWITADGAHGGILGGGSFAAEGCADVDAVNPVEGLINKRHHRAAPPAEDEGADLDPRRVIGGAVEHRVIAHRRGEPAVGMRRRRALGRRPFVAQPVDAPLGRLLGFAFPPDIAIGQ